MNYRQSRTSGVIRVTEPENEELTGYHLGNGVYEVDKRRDPSTDRRDDNQRVSVSDCKRWALPQSPHFTAPVYIGLTDDKKRTEKKGVAYMEK